MELYNLEKLLDMRRNVRKDQVAIIPQSDKTNEVCMSIFPGWENWEPEKKSEWDLTNNKLKYHMNLVSLDIIKNHAGKFSSYRDVFSKILSETKNPKKEAGYQNILFLADDSTAYIEAEEDRFRVHYWYHDDDMMCILRKSEYDYLIWATPNKELHDRTNMFVLPKAVVIDLNALRNAPIKYVIYDESKMI